MTGPKPLIHMRFQLIIYMNIMTRRIIMAGWSFAFAVHTRQGDNNQEDRHVLRFTSCSQSSKSALKQQPQRDTFTHQKPIKLNSPEMLLLEDL